MHYIYIYIYIIVLLPGRELRHGNNSSKTFSDQCNALAAAVKLEYGEEYQECVDYLIGLSRNRFYTEARLPGLPWHAVRGNQPQELDPCYQLHPIVLAALAPSAPLRAAFGGARNV